MSTSRSQHLYTMDHHIEGDATMAVNANIVSQMTASGPWEE